MRRVSKTAFAEALRAEKGDTAPTPPVSSDTVVEILHEGRKYALDTRHCLIRGFDGAVGIGRPGTAPHFGLCAYERKLVEAIPRVKVLLDQGFAKFLATGEV